MKVFKWGDDLAVELPKTLVDELHLAPGDELAVVAVSKTKLAVEKRDRRAEALEKLRFPLPPGYRFARDEANER